MVVDVVGCKLQPETVEQVVVKQTVVVVGSTVTPFTVVSSALLDTPVALVEIEQATRQSETVVVPAEQELSDD